MLTDLSLTDPGLWGGLFALIIMEIVLGIDNVIFISLVIDKLDGKRKEFARKLGLGLAMIMRILLLMTISWIIGLKQTVFEIADNAISWRDIILIGGGLFLIAKATSEIYQDVEGEAPQTYSISKSFVFVILQIIMIDMVFSLDSIITAVGMTPHLEIMVIAVIVSVIVMYFASKQISEFIKAHPSTKVLALGFLLLVGAALIADGFDFHIPRGYIYFAMGFAAFIEFINIYRRSKS